MKFKARPVLLEAIQYLGPESVLEMRRLWGPKFDARTYIHFSDEDLEIQTLDLIITAIKGDWVVMGPMGSFRVYKPDIFIGKYEPAEPYVSPTQR